MELAGKWWGISSSTTGSRRLVSFSAERRFCRKEGRGGIIFLVRIWLTILLVLNDNWVWFLSWRLAVGDPLYSYNLGCLFLKRDRFKLATFSRSREAAVWLIIRFGLSFRSFIDFVFIFDSVLLAERHDIDMWELVSNFYLEWIIFGESFFRTTRVDANDVKFSTIICFGKYYLLLCLNDSKLLEISGSEFRPLKLSSLLTSLSENFNFSY